MNFQDVILNLQNYWSSKGCALHQPYDIEVGAGTFNPCTFFRVLGPEPYNAAYVEPSRRPADGRYGENPNRLQHYYQFQVILKPSPEDVQDLYLDSLISLGVSHKIKDRSMEGKTLWVWSQALWKKGNLDEAISRGQKALKIYEELKKSEASDIRAQIEKWSED